MATLTQLLPSHMITFLILISLTTIHSTQQDHRFVKSLDPKTLQLNKEKLTHFRVYWHDVVSGSAPTSVAVVNPYKNSSTAFGLIRMIDNALTEEPDVKSKLVGRAQGFYSSTSQSDVILLMSMNFAFFVGKYNGSTITVLGRNDVFSKIREMPVIGGSGLFRYARGYAEARTHTVNLKTGDAVVEYNVYVLHY